MSAPKPVPPEVETSPKPLTLAEFAEAKALPAGFLQQQGVSEDSKGLILAYHFPDGSRGCPAGC